MASLLSSCLINFDLPMKKYIWSTKIVPKTPPRITKIKGISPLPAKMAKNNTNSSPAIPARKLSKKILDFIKK